jgi:hypothetical protein
LETAFKTTLGDIRENDKSHFRMGKPKYGEIGRRAKGRKVEERGNVRTHKQERERANIWRVTTKKRRK